MSAPRLAPLLFLSFLLLLFTSGAHAQHSYNIDYITAEGGLPSDGIKGLQWDERSGFLWIATEGGIVRYDGQQLYLFHKDNVEGINSDRIFPLTKDLGGHLYGIYNRIVFRIENNKLVRINLNIPEGRGHAGSLLYLHVSTPPPANVNPDISNFDRYLPIDPEHCIIDKNDTLYLYKGGEGHKTVIIPKPKDYTSFKIGNTVFYFNGKDAFYQVDIEGKRLIPVYLGKSAGEGTGLTGERKHLYWEAGMEQPILLGGTNAWQLSYKDGKIFPELICNEIPQNYAIKYAQYWQKGEVLFLGTQSKGIIVIRKNYLENIRKNNSGFDEPNAIYSQILLPNGNVLANTGDILGPSKASLSKLPILGPFNNNLIITRDSVLWYTARDSLFSYDYKTNVHRFISRFDGSYYAAFGTTNGKVYAANYSGIYEINDNKPEYVCRFKDLGDPFDMEEMEPGVLALAMNKGGLFRFNTETKKFDTLLVEESPVRSLWKYRSYLFVGTYGEGIYVYKDGVIKALPLDNNNYLRYAHCFVLDKLGYCWMSTNRGLFKARLQDMLDAFEHNTPYIYYHFFGKNEGMEITEMNGGCKPCGITLENGDISFPTMDGALWVDPAMPARMPDGNVFIDQVLVNGKRMDSTEPDGMTFGANVHDISITLAFSGWCDKENLYLFYSLDPLFRNWLKIDASHPVIHLNNLPSGKYDLYIRKLEGFGQQNYATRKLSFEILAPWYLSWWGMTLIVFGALLIIAIIAVIANRQSLRRQIRLRNLLDKKTKEILKQNEKLEKNDRIKTRLISIISHDIVTPLKYLHLTTKYLSEEKQTMPDNLRDETLAEVVNTSRELELLSTNILNWIKYQNEERRIVKEKVDLHDLVEQIFGIVRSLAHKNNTELVNGISKDTLVFQFVDPLRIILYNLVVNAINFTRNGSVIISSNMVFENVQVQVKDTGLGMNKNQVNNLMSENVVISSANVNKRSGNGLGYLIIKDLLKMIDGAFHIESEPGTGTSVYIIFPGR